MTLLYIILTGFLARADGWGTKDPFWDSAAIFFNAITCSLLFAILTAFYAPPLVAVVAGVAFWLFRAPGFNSWTDWLQVLWRGFWTSFAGFTILSIAAHGNPHYGFLSVPFSAFYALTYVGGYKWLPDRLLGFNQHVWIEHASAWLFGLSVLLIIGARA